MEHGVIISVENLVKNYGSFEAVKGISFQVYENEIFGLLGPNGAGKSTTLEIIETLRSKTNGTITVDGIDLDKDPQEIKKIIGVQLQTSGYYPNLTLLELINLFAGLYNRKVNAMDLLDTVNLRDKAKSKVKELSGGQKQRISIARALIKKTPILLLDDTLSAVDTRTENMILTQVKEYMRNKTSIVITHKIAGITSFDKIVVLDDGKIVEMGKHNQLIDNKGLYHEMFQRQQMQENKVIE